MSKVTSIETQPVRWLLGVLLLGGIVRLVLVLGFNGSPVSIWDARDYNQLALNIAHRGEFAYEAGRPTSLRPPFYPVVVAAIYRVAGDENFLAVRIVQGCLGLMTAWGIFLLTQGLFGTRIGILAAALASLYPSLLFFETQLLTETLFTCLLVWMCFSVNRFLTTGAVKWLILVGVLHGLATLTRSILWLFPPFMMCFFWFAMGRRFQFTLLRRAGLCVVPPLVFGLVVAPWAIRNTRLHQTFTTIDVMSGRNFMMGNYEYTPLFRAWSAIGVEGDQSWDSVLRQETPGYSQLTQGQRDKLAMKRGLRFVLQNPLLTAQRDFVKFLNFWQLERTLAAGLKAGFWGEFSRPVVVGVSALAAGAYVFVVLLAVLGFTLVVPNDKLTHAFLIFIVLFLCAVHTVVFAHERYRVSAMPLIGIYAAAAMANLKGLQVRRFPIRLGAAIAGCLFLIASWAWEVLYVEWGRIASM